MDFEDFFGMLIGFMAVTMPIWIVWIVMHYRAKRREARGLGDDESRQLEELNEAAERMAERIKTLESILDAETPEWRDYQNKDYREKEYHGKE